MVGAANVVLDAGPLGLLSQSSLTEESSAAMDWLLKLSSRGVNFYVAEVADYEVRRELLHAGKHKGLRWLDAMVCRATYLPLSTPVMRQAAELWARARQKGLATADKHGLDCDVILCAQAMVLGAPDCVIATTNAGHIGRFFPAARWEEIAPL